MALTLKKRTDSAKEKETKGKAVGLPGKSKRRKFLSGARFVLFIGDEGTILLHIKNNTVLSRQFVPDASEQNLEELRVSLNQDVKAPLSLVIDSMDQSYTQQTLPPVSAMSVKKLISRRLERDFAPTDIKGALLLGREDSGRKDWNFMMVSIERSRQIALWLDFTWALPNRFQGIYLMSVETENIVKNLDQALGRRKANQKGNAGAKWKFFVSHNKVGGFRQVVLRDGRIIFTRMSQPIGESTPEVIAGNIEQEIQSTIEYMKRLTYNTQAGLDIYIVASSAIKPLIDKNKFVSTTFTVLTPFDVAQYFGIEGTQPTDQFGDVVMAAAIATSPKHVLTLTTPESKQFDQLYTAFRLQRWSAAVLMLGILGYAGSIASDIYLKYLDSADLERAKVVHQQGLNALRDDIKRSNLDVDNIADLMEQYQLLLQQNTLPFSFLTKVQTILKAPIIVKTIEWSVDDKTLEGNSAIPAKATIVFTLQFPGVTDAETFKAVSKKVLADLQAVFEKFTITFSKIPPQYAGTDNVNLSFDSAAPPPPVSKDIPDVQLTFKEN